MKTKLLQLLFILFSLSSVGQINIQERTKKNATQTSVNKLSSQQALNKSLAEFIISDQSEENKKKIETAIKKSTTYISILKALDSLANISKGKIVDEEKDIFYYDYYKSKKDTLQAELKALNKQKENLNNNYLELKNLKTLIEDKTSKIKDYDEIIEGQLHKWFPSRLSTRDVFYSNLFSKDNNKNSYLLDNITTQIGNNTAAISSELVSSYIKMIRVSFGTLMTNTGESNSNNNDNTATPVPPASNTDATDAFQRLLSSGGGNLFLKFDFPLYYAQSKLGTFFVNSSSRIGTTVKQFSNDIDTASGSGNSSINMYASVSSDDQKSFIFFLNSSFGGYFGGGDYYSKLNLAKNGLFAFSHLTVGVDVSSSIRITYMFRSFASDENLRSTRGVVGIQLLKGLFD